MTASRRPVPHVNGDSDTDINEEQRISPDSLILSIFLYDIRQDEAKIFLFGCQGLSMLKTLRAHS